MFPYICLYKYCYILYNYDSNYNYFDIIFSQKYSSSKEHNFVFIYIFNLTKQTSLGTCWYVSQKVWIILNFIFFKFLLKFSIKNYYNINYLIFFIIFAYTNKYIRYYLPFVFFRWTIPLRIFFFILCHSYHLHLSWYNYYLT